MNVFIGGSKGYSLHIHTNGDAFSLVRASVHHLVFNQRLCLCLGGSSSSEGLLTNKSNLHAFDFYLDQMEVDSSDDDVFQVIERLVVLEVDVQAIFNTNLHLHWDNFSRPLNLLVGEQDCEVDFLDDVKLSGDDHTNKISNSSCNPIKGFVLLFEIRKLELVRFVFCENASWFKFFGDGRELSAQVLVGVDFQVGSEVPKYPTRQHLMPRCQNFLESLSWTLTVPLISSFLLQTGSLIFSFPFLILWYFWFSLRSNCMSISTEPVSPPKKELIFSCIASLLPLADQILYTQSTHTPYNSQNKRLFSYFPLQTYQSQSWLYLLFSLRPLSQDSQGLNITASMDNINRMKSNPIMLMKQDKNKQRNNPNELKHKLGSLSTDSVADYYLSKLDTKPRSTSKSADKSLSLNFSKSYLAPSQNHRVGSGDKHKPIYGSVKSNSGHIQVPLLRVEKPTSHQVSKNSHFHSADRQLRKTKSGSKSKSYLIEYLSQKHHSKKTESLGKLGRVPREDSQKKNKPDKIVLMKEKINNKGIDLKIRIGHRTRQGVLISNPSKPNQDSYVIAELENKAHLFAVADGHGAQGHLVSQVATRRLQQFFKQQSHSSKAHDKLFSEVYQSIQKELFSSKELNAHTSGSTMITLMLEPKGLLTCANVGDSRAILARQIDKKNWEIIHLSEDHKPSLDKEKKRIIRRGGKVHCFRDEHGNQVGPQRVWLPNQNVQGLAMSRSLGDNISKPIGVTHEPEVIQLQLQERDKFILVASDGVWEFIQNYEVLQLVVPYFKEGKLQQCCDALLKLAYERWTVEDNTVVDDITFVLLFLNQ